MCIYRLEHEIHFYLEGNGGLDYGLEEKQMFKILDIDELPGQMEMEEIL